MPLTCDHCCCRNHSPVSITLSYKKSHSTHRDFTNVKYLQKGHSERCRGREVCSSLVSSGRVSSRVIRSTCCVIHCCCFVCSHLCHSTTRIRTFDQRCPSTRQCW